LKLTLLRASQFVEFLAAPSHLLTHISFEVESKAGVLVLLGFQPKGLSEIPLYSEKSLADAGRESIVLLLDVALRREEVLVGGFGAAIVKARDMLIFIPAVANDNLICWTPLMDFLQYNYTATGTYEIIVSIYRAR
jgi:glyoxylase-like metal-dependent hydrolase (beta-lactamase superfamily II)